LQSWRILCKVGRAPEKSSVSGSVHAGGGACLGFSLSLCPTPPSKKKPKRFRGKKTHLSHKKIENRPIKIKLEVKKEKG